MFSYRSLSNLYGNDKYVKRQKKVNKEKKTKETN